MLLNWVRGPFLSYYWTRKLRRLLCLWFPNQSLSFHTENGTFWAFEVDEQSAYVIEFHAIMCFCPAALETAFMRVGCWWRRKRAWKQRFYYVSESVKAWTAHRRILCPRFSTATQKPLTLRLCQSRLIQSIGRTNFIWNSGVVNKNKGTRREFQFGFSEKVYSNGTYVLITKDGERIIPPTNARFLKKDYKKKTKKKESPAQASWIRYCLLPLTFDSDF